MSRLGLGLAALLIVSVSFASAHADTSFPYGDRATAHVADVLHATNRGGWVATTRDINGYSGRRHAEEVKIPTGHGKRWVGIIHVPSGKGGAAASALSGTWFARKGTQFVLPLRSSTDTDGCAGDTCKVAAQWAKRRLGAGWILVAP